MIVTVGVLALQGAFFEHLKLLRRAAEAFNEFENGDRVAEQFDFTEVRNVQQLRECDALIIPGGESTTIAFIAAQSGLLEPLRDFVKVDRRPVWGTCAGLILLAEAANSIKKGGQELIGGLDVRVNRNHFGRQVESFQADVHLPFLESDRPFPGVFIRAPVVEKIMPHVEGVQQGEQNIEGTILAPSRVAKDNLATSAMSSDVKVMGILPGRLNKARERGAEVSAEGEAGDIVAVRQGNVFGTSFHPELTEDMRIHVWWLQEVLHRVQKEAELR